VLRLCDLLAVAVDDMRQGGDPRLPLELALVKVTRPGADLSRESLAFRVEQLERGRVSETVSGTVSETRRMPGTESGTAPGPEPDTVPGNAPEPPTLELEQLREAWQRSVLPAVEQRAIHAAPVFGEARPAALQGDTLTLEFPRRADFHRKLAEEKYAGLLGDALYEVTGRRLTFAFEVGETGSDDEAADEEPTSEEDFLTLIKQTFDAQEVDDA
jgi:hypothetical protein